MSNFLQLNKAGVTTARLHPEEVCLSITETLKETYWMPIEPTAQQPALHVYELGQSHTADSWLISDWTAGQTSIMNWSDDNVRVGADGRIELVLDRAPEGASRPWEGGEIQGSRSATTGTWSWTAQAPEMAPGAVFGMFTYKSDWKNAPWTEFDFEFVGGDTTKVELNIHMIDASGKHVTLSDNKANKVVIDLGFDAADGIHTYEVSVSETGATFYVDGKVVGDFTAADMPGGTWNLNPMLSYVDLWAAPRSMESWTGPWTDPGRPLVARISDAEIRPGQYGSTYVPEVEPEAAPPVQPDTDTAPDEDADAAPPATPAPQPAPAPAPDAGAVPGDAPKGSIVGGSGNDALEGGSGHDKILGLGGDDTLDGKGGADEMHGGTGNDTYWVDNAADRIIERSGEGYDWTHASVNWTLSSDVEALSLRTAAHINGTGNGSANFIKGNSGNNVISGMAGDDVLEGRGGNDVLIGGTGNDRLIGGLGRDVFRFTAGDGQDTITDFAAAGGEVLEVQGYSGHQGLRAESGGTRVVLSSSDSIFLEGVAPNALSAQNFRFDGPAAQVPTPAPAPVAGAPKVVIPAGSIVGTAGKDELSGGSGNDRIFGLAGNDTLDGKGGADHMHGGSGDDTYWVDNFSDRTIEKAGEGYDWTHASIDWTLSDHVEALALRTGANLDGTGNSAANFISGNSGNNVISGMAGDDVLEGRGGDDRLIGGSGSDKLSGNAGKDIMFGGDDLSRDTFIFNAASDSRVGSGRDVVHDFVSGVDKLDFSSFDANRSASGSQDFRYSGTAAAANSVWTVDAGSNLLVRGDVDGDRTADFEVLITDIESLTRADFLF
ncbi:MAG: family 16 glycosylhydrolase [Pseudomonadota bacterium]|nr:family 16 glycosylhydrolase [Pseudomonadota bacterium]